MIRVVMPAHLRSLARVNGEVTLEIEQPPTQRHVIDAIESRFPMLRGTIRDHVKKKRRPYIRFYGCQRDLSHDALDDVLPEPVASGKEPFLIVGAMSGG
ncbi:MAG: MoaD/ThiS family protein [Candidatus Eremiobacteraeota bacterium]|nr:MoaD/ThiS family protein [Candidatus Eremiobacteraeota bacterium]